MSQSASPATAATQSLRDEYPYVVRVANAFGEDHYFGYQSASAARWQAYLEPGAEIVSQPEVRR